MKRTGIMSGLKKRYCIGYLKSVVTDPIYAKYPSRDRQGAEKLV